jgi:hypothetical protein
MHSPKPWVCSFGMNRIGTLAGDLLRCIIRVLNISSRYFGNAISSIANPVSIGTS